MKRARDHLATPPPRVVVIVLLKSESEGCRAKELRIDGRRITSEDTQNDLDMKFSSRVICFIYKGMMWFGNESPKRVIA